MSQQHVLIDSNYIKIKKISIIDFNAPTLRKVSLICM